MWCATSTSIRAASSPLLNRSIGRRFAVIGYAIADTLFGTLNPLDKEIEVDGKVYQVIGVMEKAPGDLRRRPG